MDLATDSRQQGVGAPVPPTSGLNDCIKKFQSFLTNDDFAKIKFLCRPWIGTKWNSTHTFQDLTNHLLTVTEFRSNDQQLSLFLTELFYTIQRHDLLKFLNSCRHLASQQSLHKVDPNLKYILNLVESIEVDNAEDINHILVPVLNLQPQLVDPVKTLLNINEGKHLEDVLRRIVPGKSHFEEPQKRHVATDSCYPMRTDGECGLCIIINNEKFDDEQKNRLGTQVDKANLINDFGEFNFRVITRDNLTASEIISLVGTEAAKMDHTNYDCFVCCILSHGLRGKVLGVDDGEVDLYDDLLFPFCKNAKTMFGKPKLFFIQACQGDTKMLPTSAPCEKRLEESAALQTDAEEQMEEDGSFTLPTYSDFLMYISSIPGFASYRSPSKGTWFINALHNEFKSYGENEDLKSVLTRVNDQVALSIGKIKGQQYTQAPECRDNLRRPLILKRRTPGRLPEEA